LVGRVTKATSHSTRTSYQITDSTGTADVVKWIDKNPDAEMDAEGAAIFKYGVSSFRLSWIFTFVSSEGSYVRVYANYRTFQGKAAIQANHISVVDSIDEVTHHNLDCIYTSLYLTKGPPQVRFCSETYTQLLTIHL
jgi:replication factor A2